MWPKRPHFGHIFLGEKNTLIVTNFWFPMCPIQVSLDTEALEGHKGLITYNL